MAKFNTIPLPPFPQDSNFAHVSECDEDSSNKAVGKALADWGRRRRRRRSSSFWIFVFWVFGALTSWYLYTCIPAGTVIVTISPSDDPILRQLISIEWRAEKRRY